MLFQTPKSVLWRLAAPQRRVPQTLRLLSSPLDNNDTQRHNPLKYIDISKRLLSRPVFHPTTARMARTSSCCSTSQFQRVSAAAFAAALAA